MVGELFHLVAPSELAASTADGFYRPSSLETDGFVHLSTEDQLADTRQRYFADVDDLVVLRLDAGRLADVRYEDLYGHGMFPHLYGPVPLDAIVAVEHGNWDGENQDGRS